MKKISRALIVVFLIAGLFTISEVQAVEPAMPAMGDYSASPIFTVATAPPMVMLVMGRDHKLYYEAYNDASDLNGDGKLDVGYNPEIDYYGYFDSYKCYVYINNRFEPSPPVTTDKTCSNKWSGDFLNYVTMSRMDTMRKVLYGGYRSTDTGSETVLERVFIPQDAHSWGKEYESIQKDGYDIRNYTPLNIPAHGTRHLFANTTLSTNGPPLMRVLNDSIYRIWQWVAIERPVAGNRCMDGGSGPYCATSGGESWEIVPAGVFENLTQTTYNIAGISEHPNNHDEFNELQATYGIESKKFGSGSAVNINSSGNPFGADDYYMTIFQGKINIPAAGTYVFAVDGDDAVEVMINGSVVTGWYGGHGRCNTDACLESHSGSIYLTAGQHDLVFRHEEMDGGDSYHLYWKKTIPSSSMTDYHVRVQVGVSSMPEPNCKQYGGENGPYKPVGLLQKHGETDKMYFGLMTGSYAKNMSGGVLRKNIGSIKDEINPDTGIFTNVNGIIQTINKFKIVDFNYSGYQYNGGWLVDKPMPQETSKKFPDWGNPIAEMMYETLRYFADGKNPTADYNYSGTTPDSILGLPQPSWEDPFLQPDANDVDQNLYCAKPIMLVISDINPSYDSDQVPGSAFASGWSSGQVLGEDTLNVQQRLNEISGDVEGLHFIGQVGSSYDSSCSPKDVNGLGNVRGLCPEEPTKQGGYYAGAVAHYGRNTDLRPDLSSAQKVSTYAVALSSPLPEITIPVGSQNVTLVPFGKTVVAGGLNASQGAFQPTCTIVDFFVEEIAEDKSHGKFRINFEDVEQGADHDMDVIVLYEYWVQEDNTINIKLTKEYQAAGYVMHLGYIISGTTKDGIYLEVASKPGSDIAYFLDTPTDRDEPGRGLSTRLLSYGISGDNTVYSRERIFTPSNDPAAKLLKDPLWYAAKWGGDEDGRDWDKDGDGIPDTYFYVINPLKLEKELNKAFASILEKAASGTSASVLATTSRGEGNILQAYFHPTIPNNDDVKWLGYLQNLWVDSKGHIRENTGGPNDDGSYSLNIFKDKILVFETDNSGDTFVKKYAVSDEPFPDIYDPSITPTIHNMNEILPIWEAGKKLLQKSASKRNIYTFTGDTSSAPNEALAFGSGNVIAFNEDLNLNSIRPYLGVLCNDDENCFYDYLGSDVEKRAKNLIKYIRGEDIEGLRPRTVKDEDNTELGVWKLGDIVNSSPAAVSRPPNNYHLIYGDKTYQDYYIANRNRETVVYVGANDGMLHAFTSWKYDSQNREYTKPSDAEEDEDIGDEIWAYIPQSLLPHLKWLPDPDYSHVYYVDQMPLVADAKIGGTWKTLLIGGLRMGGKEIKVYEDFGNGNENKTFYPTYFCIDITDPRNPELLWERTYDNMGFSFSVPTIVVADNWYLVFGSGPTDYDGTSKQNGLLFVVDLATGDPKGFGENDWAFEGDDFAYFSSPTSMDKDLIVADNKFTHEHVYIGQSYLDTNVWKGKIYRMDIDSGSPDTWGVNSIFSIDAPINASLALSVDRSGNTWIFGGTGRYIEQSDKTTTDDQYLFGFKDPLYNPGRLSGSYELSLSDLYRVDRLMVTTSKVILDKDSNTVSSNTPTWDHLLGKTDVDYSSPIAQHKDGWYRALPKPGERCVTKPSIIGGLSLMPSFVPKDDVCGFGGESFFYSLYYKTGTGYYNPTFRKGGTKTVGDYTIVLDEIALGYGMPASQLGIHVGEQEGATALIQLGTGGIIKIDVDTAIDIRSGILNWREN